MRIRTVSRNKIRFNAFPIVDPFRRNKIRKIREIGFNDVAHVVKEARENDVALVDGNVYRIADYFADGRDAQLMQLQIRHDRVRRIYLARSFHALILSYAAFSRTVGGSLS